MTLDEIRTKVQESEYSDWLANLELKIDFKHINFSVNLKGAVAIYEFASMQAEGWVKNGEELPEQLKESKSIFSRLRAQVYQLIDNRFKYSKERDWDDMKSEVENVHRKYFTYDCPEVAFLIRVFKEFPYSFHSAFRFISNNIKGSESEYDEFIGNALAYEFLLKEQSEITQRRNLEKASIGKIKSDLFKYYNESELQFSEYLKRTNERFETYTGKIDDLYTQKENNFNEWFKIAQQDTNAFATISHEKISGLETAYEQLLSLKKPAEYWNKRAIKLNLEGKVFLKWLVLLVLFGCVTLYFLLWLTPEGMLLSFITGEASAIKWSIVYITFISLLAFGIRIVSKAMFSSFHLARDAEEREQLTYVYLALIKESAVDSKDKNLIMQSLFSRSDTGLLKEDSGPTMPGNIPNKLIQ